MSDLNKDIEKLEKAIKVLTGNDTGVALDFEGTAKAIENVLAELKIKDTEIEFRKKSEEYFENREEILMKELETYKTLVDKYGGAEQLEKYLLGISQALGNATICSAKTVIEDKNEVIRCLKSELETWKKIADKLAEKIEILDKDVDVCDNIPLEECPLECVECIIDIARKEVDK